MLDIPYGFCKIAEFCGLFWATRPLVCSLVTFTTLAINYQIKLFSVVAYHIRSS